MVLPYVAHLIHTVVLCLTVSFVSLFCIVFIFLDVDYLIHKQINPSASSFNQLVGPTSNIHIFVSVGASLLIGLRHKCLWQDVYYGSTLRLHSSNVINRTFV